MSNGRNLVFKSLVVVLISAFLLACGGSDPVGRAALQAVEGGARLIDVRTTEEIASGHLPDAINIPHGDIVSGVKPLQADKAASIVLYCRSGNRSGIAEGSLREAGYSNVVNAGAYSELQPVWDSRG